MKLKVILDLNMCALPGIAPCINYCNSLNVNYY